WLDPTPATDLTSTGLTPTDHPLLTAATTLPDLSDLHTGRLTPHTHTWLADHAVHGTPLAPGTALLDLVLHAAAHTDAPYVEELALHAPLPLHPTESQTLQLTTTAPDPLTGHRALALYTTADHRAFTHHATATLTPRPVPAPDVRPWSDAEQRALAPVEGLYERLAEVGFGYGPAFRGLRSRGRIGADVLAEVGLPEELRTDVGRFGIHPALLDAALHACLLDGADGVRLPFVWSGVTLHATGADVLRVRLSPVGTDSLSLTAFDEAGHPVVSVASVTLRAVTPEQFRAAVRARRQDPLYEVRWAPPPEGGTAGSGGAGTAVLVGPVPAGLSAGLPTPSYPDLGALLTDGKAVPTAVVVGCAGDPDEASVEAAVHTVLGRALESLREWLADERLSGSRLVLLTRGAVAVREGEGVSDLAAAAVWGLVRSAQSEHPGRLVIADVDEDPESYRALTAFLEHRGAAEPQLAVRAGEVFAARLGEVELVEHVASASTDPEAGAGVFDGDGTVLITGGTGTLGSLLARHLVTDHGVRHLHLLSRQGPHAPGAHRLRTALEDLGATIAVTACDVSDPTSLTQALARIPHDHPLTAVVHTAGALDDATLDALTPSRVATVLRPKADAAWHLHHLTRNHRHPLKAFVLFSSAAGVLGQAGQASYSAANAFLDALAVQRRAEGLPALSLAWGLWADASGMTGHLGEADLRRLRRTGLSGMASEEGLALFDAALRTSAAQPDRAVLVPARLDLTAARAGGEVPALLSGLVRPAVRRAATGAGTDADGGKGTAALRDRLAGLAPDDRGRALLDLVRRHTAVVLGHAEPRRVDPERGFLDVGLDSLTALELRNRLGAEAGLVLPATLVFNHPTPAAVARFLDGRLFPEQEPAEAASLPSYDVEGTYADAADGIAVDPVDPVDPIDPIESIDSMDLDDLIRAALRDT
ncbi:type I polyketide synthase, partial [Streptomyces sp. NBC_01275]|uniref:type I polyketide synthase n=1 Tax=Streptomyces sp. NBC_01275 TaxID=2903807 RepID=UPI00224E76DC